jgi:transposase
MGRTRGLIPEKSPQAAIDSTGYEAGHTSHYYGRVCGLRKSHYPKLTAVCDTKAHIYTSAVANQGPFPDHREFAAAVLEGYGNQPFDEILADAGYDAEHHHQLVRDVLGATSVIAPNAGRPTRKLPPGRYRREMVESFPKERFGQRWQVESSFSQDKRRFGSFVSGRSYWSRCRNLLLRVLVHNAAIIRRLACREGFNRAGLTPN